jgi:hypothetical protein
MCIYVLPHSGGPLGFDVDVRHQLETRRRQLDAQLVQPAEGRAHSR